MLKGIIFDMDGVLINSEPFHFKVWKETLKRRGVDLDYSV
ncbi:MAG TPA: HAD hydrolase-like protein, partial [Candidatus Blautia merdipullorum]|nr:HAD hydrolase-like protein [Candidatus Blautia merdipullorum]